MGSNLVIVHPNRDRAIAKATKALVILLLIASAVLIAIVTIGGWEKLQGAQTVAIAYMIVFPIMAIFVARWNRGVLPLTAGLATLFGVMAAVAAPGWFARDKGGFEDPTIAPELLGLLTIVLVGVLFATVIVAMGGFSQKWNVELEVTEEEARRGVDAKDFDAQGRRIKK